MILFIASLQQQACHLLLKRGTLAKISHIALTIFLSAVTAFAVVRFASPAQTTSTKETRLEQIKRTGVLRCGYIIWPPVMMKDANTGKMSGLSFDLFEEIGKELSVKVEWTTEVAPANAFAEMEANRFDMVCTPYYVTPARARESGFTMPVLFHPTYLFARTDDTRFDNNYAAANDPAVRFATIDGDFSSVGADQGFPKAKKLALAQNATSGDLFLNVADGKADVVVSEPTSFMLYNANNPDKIRQVKGTPLRVMAVSFPLPPNDQALKNTLDASLTYLQGSGFLDRLLDRYEPKESKFLRLPKPYSLPQ